MRIYINGNVGIGTASCHDEFSLLGNNIY